MFEISEIATEKKKKKTKRQQIIHKDNKLC